MTVVPEKADMVAAMFEAEWVRVDRILTLAEAVSSGQVLGEDFARDFDAAAQAVEAARDAGAWAGLATVVDQTTLAALKRIDLDLLVLALAPVAHPSFASRLHSLQPHIGSAWPSLPLLQDLLMLDSSADLDLLFAELAPTSPLVTADLLRVDGVTPYQTIRPTPQLIRAMLNRDAELAPPPGANLLTRRGTWNDLILPATAMAQLRDFTAWIRHADRIRRDWGGKAIHGPLALFSGASGTGKSFAACVIASALSQEGEAPWALYTLDLGRIMSKYVGETEANLNALLESLDGRRAILQIDEADGLLGKRGEISDARDRYANLEVSHMLSRFERHMGPVILTTNLRSNVDSAFLRRFQLVVDFPAPDDKARAELWDRLLPEGAPRDPALDLMAVGAAVRMSGGAISNAAHYAAVLAAEAETGITPAFVARAVWAELMKGSRQVRKSEIGFLGSYLDPGAGDPS
ncbi:ATP-binding protein [Kordiimonas marina]|uniref:ATP-binding protein n=1 Tax=Kordiimonas marina TaxID=2872312 RepID=UPI001FF4C095|nr:ATP-binding protein [Kordiimonas marina]MCJ9429318.1 ATP-binding protein [Kordiimonas marina]